MTTFITGAAGTGKTTELLRRALEAASTSRVLVTSVSRSALETLRERAKHSNINVRELHDVAFEMLPPQTQEIDDVRAATLFADAARPLLTLEWREIIEAEIDPEVPGLRSPDRFLDAAFRLFCKLRDARIPPQQFLESSLRGATQFYAKPPNFAHPDLLYYTKENHRDSLHADGTELQRQYRREVDLAKILAKLYRSYLDHPVRQGCLTPRDAIAQAADLFESDPAAADALRERYPQVFVDDAQELTIAELALLQAAYGANLDGVTLAGDPDSATSTFRGARFDRVFALSGERITLETQLRSPSTLDAACRHLLGAAGGAQARGQADSALTLFRASTRRAEAQFIAEYVVDLLSSGVPHDDIAILFRSARNIRPYRDALLDRNVCVQVAGDLNIFEEPEVVDALAVLWFVHDPFRHDYLLRVLGGPAMGLSDASVHALCGEPPDAQTLLFEDMAEDPDEARAGRWDPKRDVRLAWNVLHGDQDNQLSGLARERLTELREKLRRWRDALVRMQLPDFARLVWSEGLAAAGAPGSARAHYQQQMLARLHERITCFAAEHPNAGLAEFLLYAQARMESAFESWELGERPGAVRMLSIDAARGREFDYVVIPAARAGSFPRWYVPDAFLYSPSLGMVAKENVGDARAARTAKFTYYMFRTKAREHYNREERRAFVYALRRARKTVLVTACERATRGVTAPEFLAELQAARLPGVTDFSDRWRPTRAVFAG
jgi:superfamily I DNA/RNA helicase